MDSRFTFKDFVFTVLFVLVLGAVTWTGCQFNHQEKRLSAARDDLERLSRAQHEQMLAVDDIRRMLKSGVVTTTMGGTSATGTAETQSDGRIVRRKMPGGGLYVYMKEPPQSPRDPRHLPDYAAGDWVVRNLGSEPAVITPYIEKDYYGSLVQAPVMETLITRNPDTLEWEPLLAESYEIIPEKLMYRFVLRENIFFSDGTKITADDVLFSFNTAMFEGVDSDRLKSYLKQIKSVVKVDDRTIEMTFSKPYFLGLEVAGAYFEIIPRHIYKFNDAKEFNSRTDLLVGSGPYLFDAKRWVKGQQISMVRNEQYWGARPNAERIVFRFISNAQAGLQAFQNEEIDWQTPQPDQFDKFSKDAEFKSKFTIRKFAASNSGYRYIGWNQARPMFKDKLTRQALTELLDRGAIIKTIEKELSFEITGPFSPLVPQSDKSVKPWPYDPEDARKKLEAAGWKPGEGGILTRDGKPFRFSLMIPSQSVNYEQIAVYVKEQFKKVGIDVTVSPYEFSVLVERLDNRDFDAAMLRWTGSIEGDPTQIWHSDSTKDKGSNYISFRNPEADALIVSGREELNEEKRMEIWHKFHRLLHEEQPYTFLHGSMSLAFINKRFENTEPYKIGLSWGDWYVPAGRQKYR